MKIINLRGLDDLFEVDNLSLILGYFDGVHIGHMQLINFARENSKDNLGLLTFDKPINKSSYVLTSLDDKIELFKYLGIDYLFIIHVDEDLKRMKYNYFIDKVLKKINPQKLFCGPDFRYGYKAEGDVNYLKDKFKSVYVLNYVLDFNNEKISSKSIKELIKLGNIEDSTRLMGRYYHVNGKVIKGKGIGKKLGFPTANLFLLEDYVVPKDGVYITKIRIRDKEYNALTNIGSNPTIGTNNNQSIETYIIDFRADLYDETVTLTFLKRLREEIKFERIEELIDQMEKDLDLTTHYFNFEQDKRY